MKYEERALSFSCDDEVLHGILAVPEKPATRGVLVIVGGPQYRAGSHRQFTLMSRDLAAAGVAVFRFDYRGMGDSEGRLRTFEEVDGDIRAALDAFQENVSSVKEVALWGLCDGASAACFYAGGDSRVSRMVLLNPWIRSDQGMARTFVKRYYMRRLVSPEFWVKIFSGKFGFGAAARSMLSNLDKMMGHPRGVFPKAEHPAHFAVTQPPLPDRMFTALFHFRGRVLVILSGNDLTAQEFEVTASSTDDWKKWSASPKVSWKKLAGADHTFSTRRWSDQVSAWTLEWLQSW